MRCKIDPVNAYVGYSTRRREKKENIAGGYVTKIEDWKGTCTDGGPEACPPVWS
jgi:hypothetical protein